MHSRPRVVAERGDERHAVLRHLRAHGIGDVPPARPGCKQLVRVRRDGIGSERRQVLVAERVSDERIGGDVGLLDEGAECARDTARVDFDRALQPGPHADVRRIRRGTPVPLPEVALGAQLEQERYAPARLQGRHEVEAPEPQRAPVVIGVVEVADVFRSDRRRHVTADRHAAAEGGDGRRRPILRGRAPRQAAGGDEHDRTERAPEVCGETVGHRAGTC